MAVQQRQLIWSDKLQQFSDQARQNLTEGAVTPAYRAKVEEVIQLLQRAMAGEWVSTMQYMHHYFMASDLHSAEIKEFFKEQAEHEMEHMRKLGERIQLLGGVPVDKPQDVATFSPMPVEYGTDLISMLEADLIAERATIAFYTEMVRYLGNDDVVSRLMFEDFLRDEEEDADRITTFLYQFDAGTNQQIKGLHDGRVGR
ncbi:MAG TPA: ferritin-like domain-containing protein [Chloroflexota bacterium]